MTFSDYTYVRPDYPAFKQTFAEKTAKLATATSLAETRQLVQDITTLLRQIDTQANLWYIRHSIDMTDEFYNQETKFWNEHTPLFDELTTDYYRVIVASPFRQDLSDLLPDTFFMQAENKIKTFSAAAIPLFQKENELVDDYNKLIAGAEINFQGQSYNLSQMIPFGQSTDRDVRQAASEATTAYYVDHEEEFDRIYDQLVKVRTEIAQTLGFKDYVDYSYLKMNRFDYNREMVKVYRQEILKHIVPIVAQLRERQAKRLQLDSLKHYDLALTFLDGNARPQGDPDFILAQAQTMYRELSKETGEFFDFMVEHQLLDLVAKTGKDSGGYCTYIADYQSPFIFSNFNGTKGDIDVLTHEAGHAFQVYRSRWIQSPEVIWPTYETCEIHSMSMEFLTWPWMDRFFKDQVDKYKFSHLADALTFLPYGVLVDHFQQEVYEQPNMTPAERKATWARLQALYLPDRDYSDSEALSRGIFWYRQGHIFASPFYYIDYTLAQVCALQFWKRSQVDQDPTAWADYLAICDLGGSKTFLQVIETAHLNSPFQPGALETTAKAATDWLNAIDDRQL
ncbi:M3 family oligoendopeptidase [Streptococcus cuniculipharyngis]|uniref:M3 family oligoendopeptidase n=1 Tax=Streptococcus cuniculipharyngis TaxID=1562651 RepID=A0A5C5SBE0_9STRE|nr:M3 family oligoendopeptidase [Streptococcus cuniculipharyngis]TWS97159.1 M3 family oligoendopeptidase [Streptococcus cuniculipharyngis]